MHAKKCAVVLFLFFLRRRLWGDVWAKKDVRETVNIKPGSRIPGLDRRVQRPGLDVLRGETGGVERPERGVLVYELALVLIFLVGLTTWTGQAISAR